MKWLSIDQIKRQLRLDDFQVEDEKDLLELYGNSAENSILRLINRTYIDLIDNFGDVPTDLVHASLMLVDLSYQYRSPYSVQSVSSVGCTFEMKVKPYIKLVDDDTEPMQILTLGSDGKIIFTADLPDGLMLKDIEFSGEVINVDRVNTKITFTKAGCIMIGDGKDYAVLIDSETLGVGTLQLVLAVQIPDTDYPSGYRKEVIKINPHTEIKE